MRAAIAAASAVVAGMLAPGQAAHASTLSVAHRDRQSNDATVLYAAGPGEANDVTAVSIGSGIRISDPRASIQVRRPCRLTGAHTATCRVRGFSVVPRVRLGDGDDRVRFPGRRLGAAFTVLHAFGGPGADVLTVGGDFSLYDFEAYLHGGPGDDQLDSGGHWGRLHGDAGEDRLRTGQGNDRLDGGAGADVLSGGAGKDGLDGGGGQDQLYGGPGPDHLIDGDRDDDTAGGAPDSDLMVGGTSPRSLGGSADYDVVSYRRRTQPVRALAGFDDRAGEAGENDRLRDIEAVRGGAAADRLLSARTGSGLIGGPGNDVLLGARGPDALDGGPGRDRLEGGPGPDDLSGGRGRDSLSCGTGLDSVEVGSREPELVPRRCERVSFVRRGAVEIRAHPLAGRSGRPAFRLACPTNDEYLACHGTLTLRATVGRRRVLARGAFAHPDDGRSFLVRLAPTDSGRRWWARGRRARPATVILRMTSAYTSSAPFRWRVLPP